MGESATGDILGHMSIGALAARYGVSLRTLRFYEDCGILKPTRVALTRLYSEKDEIRLQLILMGKRFGFSLSEIREIIGLADRREIDSGGHFLARLDATSIKMQIDRLQQRKDVLDTAIMELRATHVDPPTTTIVRVA